MRIKKSIAENIIWFSTLAFYVLLNIIFAIVGRSGNRLGGVILMLPIGILFVFNFIRNRGQIKISISHFHTYMVLFSLFCFSSYIWAVNPATALNRGIEMFELFIVMSIVYSSFNTQTAIDDLLRVIMFGGFIVVIYYILLYGWSYVVLSMADSVRVTSDLINANSLGMAAAYSIVIYCHYYSTKQSKLWWFPLVLISLVVIAASQSRKAIVIVFLGSFGVFVLNHLNNRKFIFNALKILLFGLVLLLILFIIIRAGFFSSTFERMQTMINGFLGRGVVDNSTIERMRLKDLGKELFLSNPIFGVGIDCARYFTTSLFGKTFYLHDNYIELLADGGIIGFVIYYWIYLEILIKMLKYRDYNNPEWVICFVILLLRLVMDYGSVSFVDKYTYVFLLPLYFSSVKIERARKNAISKDYI